MKILSRATDYRINSINLYVEATFGEYLGFAKDIIENNEFQRKRVRTSKTVYSLLKKDLEKGCIMPPLVLAIIGNETPDPFQISDIELLKYIEEHVNNVLILDGLQRTYTLLDADSELSNSENYDNFKNYTIRIEIYMNIQKFGVLYRMLTLNTGQTPMTPRHQLEMLYRDMLDTDIKGITLIPDTQASADTSKNQFPFKNVIEGFYSFLNRDELPIDRADLLENIKMMENMASENMDKDLFVDFINCYFNVFNYLRKSVNDEGISRDVIEELGISNPFGYSVHKVFSTSQALTGFGAAVGRMKDWKLINGFSDIDSILERDVEPGSKWFEDLLVNLNKIKENSKKIGNAQRMYFHYFFREFFNRESDSFCNLELAVETGYRKYISQVF